MKVRRYTNLKKFYARIETYLEAEEAKNALILGIVQRVVRMPGYTKKPYLVLVEDEAGEIQFVAMHTPPFGIVLASHEADPVAAIDLLVDDLLSTDYVPTDTVGPDPLGKLFAQTWAQRSGGDYHMEMSQGVYELRKVNDETLTAAAGRMRRGTQADIPLIKKWRIAFEVDVSGELTTPMEQIDKVINTRYGDVYLWENGEAVVSMCMRSRPTRHGIAVNMVYTPDDARRHGYATTLVAQASQALLDEGYEFCTLFTDMDNPTSNAIYIKIGYEWVCGADKWKLVG